VGKLVRDRIPDIIRADGGDPHVRVLDDGEYRRALVDKLVEEALEAREASPSALLGELADVFEVLASICALQGWSLGAVEQAADAKRVERGGFDQRLWLNA